MGLTGIFLILFLIVHVGLNACIWAMDGGVMFNKAAHFMGANVVPRLLEIGLFAGFILHIFQGWSLELSNRAARKRAMRYLWEIKVVSGIAVVWVYSEPCCFFFWSCI